MTSLHSKPLALKNVTVTDSFWRTEQELVRTAVISLSVERPER